jgi:DNA-binding FrmR family transcriptional regulator
VQELAQRDALIRLKTVRGHLDGIIRMVEDDAYCVDLMKQVSAAQSSLEKVNRLILRNHLETCFTEAVNGGRGHAAIAELMDAVKFDKALTGGDASLSGGVTGEVATAATQGGRKR